MNPTNQFIRIAPDCPLQTAAIPQDKGEKQSIAMIEYVLLSAKPYHYTLEELQFAVHAQHKQITPEELKSHYKNLWDEFFSKPHACMRASSLTKKYGWGVHYDLQGNIAIYAVESKEYQRFVNDKTIKIYFAMRSVR